MSDFKEHTQMNLVAIGTVATANVLGYGFLSGRVDWIPLMFLSMPAAIVSTYALSPDLDQANNDSIKYWPIGSWWWWRLYAMLFSHRGISHWIGVGSLTRIVWSILPMVEYYFIYKWSLIYIQNIGMPVNELIFGAASEAWEQTLMFMAFVGKTAISTPKALLFVFVGVELPALLHLVQDKTSSASKATKRLIRS